ncbi:hypothetical protein LTS18_010494, partial [Coniosporium uncinatum]
DMVDRQLVTNHFLHFLALDRSDPKKFQILQLIAALLSWTDDQKETAGLARPGASGLSGLRVPLSPFRRSGSTPSLGSVGTPDMAGVEHSASKESLAELWQDFLEREAQEGAAAAGHQGVGSRKSSMAGGGMSPVLERKGSGAFSPVMGRKGSSGAGVGEGG